MIDVKHQISSVSRSLGSRELPAGEARVLTISQTYPSSIEDLWDACTNIDRIPRWFLPISGELVIGGRYQLEGNASGVVERCEPPHAFAATWEHGGAVSWIEVELSPAEGGTRFELTHVAHVDQDLWLEFGPGAVGIGWDLTLMGLARYLSAITDTQAIAVDPAEAAAWMMSDEGRDFMTLSSDVWCQASIDAGTNAGEARAAADRTTAAYTAPPPGDG